MDIPTDTVADMVFIISDGDGLSDICLLIRDLQKELSDKIFRQIS
jgi:hypothetical protein